MDATNVGVRRVHPYLWSLSSPQQPLETEDSPTVSSCPTIYIATRVPCKIHAVNKLRSKGFPVVLCCTCQIGSKTASRRVQNPSNYFSLERKIFMASRDQTPSVSLITPANADACFSISSWLSPSIIMRASGSVPE
jgi:hypothetical protein